MAKNRAGRPVVASQVLPASLGDTYLLGIGINTYAHWPVLYNAVRDVKAIAALLVSDFSLDDKKVTLLLDGDATRENIILSLEKMARTVSAKDSLLVYYAGHGHLNDRQRGFWVPADAPRDGISHYIPNSTIRDYLGDIPSLHTLLISDACFSGSLFVRGERSGELVASELAQLPSRWAICSGRHDEVVADGPAGQHSPFAESILDVLRATPRPYITTNFLLGQVREQTRSNYEQLPDGGPIHGVGHKRGEFIFRRSQTEEVAWSEAQMAGTVEALEQFVSLFPNGKNTEAAQQAIIKLKAKASWDQVSSWPAEELKEIDAKLHKVRTFCREFPQSVYFEEALAMGRDLEYKRAFISVYDSEFGLLGFIRQDTPYQDAAKQRLAQLTQETTQEPAKTASPEIEETSKVEAKPIVPAQSSAKTSSKATTKTIGGTRNPGNWRRIIVGSVTGLIALLLLIWLVRRPNKELSSAELAATKVEEKIRTAIQQRDIQGAWEARSDYQRLPEDLQNENVAQRLNEFIASYTDSLEQIKTQAAEKPSESTTLSREDFQAPPTYTNPDPLTPKGVEKTVVSGRYMVFAGSYRQRDNADHQVARLKKMGYDKAEVLSFDRGSFCVVLVDRFSTYGDAKNLVTELASKGVNAIVDEKK